MHVSILFAGNGRSRFLDFSCVHIASQRACWFSRYWFGWLTSWFWFGLYALVLLVWSNHNGKSTGRQPIG